MTRFKLQPRGISYDATLMPCGGRALTIPNQAIDIKTAVTRFSAPTITEQLQGYYESEGLELPNFELLSKLEQLDKLAECREIFKHSKHAAQDAIKDYQKKQEQSQSIPPLNPLNHETSK